jgi:predicted P-loop ATPase/GTPase
MAVINIKDENLLNLMKIQKVVQMEEGENISLDEALAKVLTFFKKFVPYD